MESEGLHPASLPVDKPLPISVTAEIRPFMTRQVFWLSDRSTDCAFPQSFSLQ